MKTMFLKSVSLLCLRGKGLASLAVLALAAGCAPTIRLDTPAPIVIDVNMKVNVVQSQAPGSQPADAGAVLKEKSPRQRQRERMAEVQTLKNDRVVGEANTGYLAIVKMPEKPEYAAYAQRIVNEENADRNAIFEDAAKGTGKTGNELAKAEAQIAKAYAERWAKGAFPGEMVQDATGNWVSH